MMPKGGRRIWEELGGARSREEGGGPKVLE